MLMLAGSLIRKSKKKNIENEQQCQLSPDSEKLALDQGMAHFRPRHSVGQKSLAAGPEDAPRRHNQAPVTVKHGCY